jgi:DNA-binding LacI/PurR family transcriptional regulator
VDRVLAAADKLNYKPNPNPNASNLARKHELKMVDTHPDFKPGSSVFWALLM